MAWFDNWRAARYLRASPYRAALAALPPGLQACWQHDAPYAYPGIPTDALFFACAAEGLLDFFDAAAHSSRPCLLPSKAADSVRRIWLRHDAAGLERFCRAHVGAAPAHAMPAAPGPGALSGALLDTLKACARITGTPPLSPRLPAVFGLDARLGMPGGHGYWSSLDGIAYAALDAHGRFAPRTDAPPVWPIPVLYGAGLVDRQAMVAYTQRSRAPDDGRGRSSDDDSVWRSGRREREYEREREREYDRQREREREQERERQEDAARSRSADERHQIGEDAARDDKAPYCCAASEDDDRDTERACAAGDDSVREDSGCDGGADDDRDD